MCWGFGSVSAHIAQSVEHFLGKEEVTGSNPVMSSIFYMAAAYGRLPVFIGDMAQLGAIWS